MGSFELPSFSYGAKKKSSVEGGECTQSVLDQILADELL